MHSRLTWILAGVAAVGIYLMMVLSQNLAARDVRDSLTCPADEQLVHSVVSSAQYRAPQEPSGRFREAYQAEWRCGRLDEATGQFVAYRDLRMWVDKRTDEVLARGSLEAVAVVPTEQGRPARLAGPDEVEVAEVLDEWQNPAGSQPDRYFVVRLTDGRQEILLSSGLGGWFRYKPE